MNSSPRPCTTDLFKLPASVRTHSESDAYRAAVVGAGISGLAAATILIEHGWSVTVFDKGRGVGGRTAVRRSGRFAFDHGAQYFTVRDKLFQSYVNSWMEKGVVDEWVSGAVAIANHCVEQAKPQKRYVGVPGMNAIAKHLAKGIDVQSNVRVCRAQYASSGWELYGDRGASLGTFGALTVALPAPQVAELLGGESTLAEQAAKYKMAPCWAVMLGFDESLNVDFDAAFIHDSSLRWIANNGRKPGRRSEESWVLHGSPQWSCAHIEYGAEEVKRILTRAFFNALALPPRRQAYSAAHLWRYALPAKPSSQGLLWDTDRILAVCGDWCCGARIEGAFLSGMAAGIRIIQQARPGEIGL